MYLAIGHFRVSLCLCFKASLSVKTILMKMKLHAELIFALRLVLKHKRTRNQSGLMGYRKVSEGGGGYGYNHHSFSVYEWKVFLRESVFAFPFDPVLFVLQRFLLHPGWWLRDSCSCLRSSSIVNLSFSSDGNYRLEKKDNNETLLKGHYDNRHF